MRKYFLIISCCISTTVFCQKQGQELIDSLIQEIPLTKDDTAVIRLYKSIADKYTNNNPVSARAYADKGKAIANNMRWNKGIAVFYSIIATIFSDAGNYDSATIYNQKALAIHKKNGDEFNVASLLNNMGVACLRQSKYTAAAAYFFESLKIGEAIKNNNLIALAYDNISTVYAAEKNFTIALENSFKALKIRQQENNTEGMAAVLSSIGSKYLETGDSANAGNYFKKALSLYEKTENKSGIAAVYNNMSLLYKKDYKLRIMYELKSQAIWDEIGPLNLLSIINTGNIGVTYLEIARNGTGEITPDENIPVGKTNHLKKAIAYFEKAIALSKETKDINNEAFFTGNLAEAQELAGDYRKAYINFRRYQRVQDSVYSQENKNKIAAIEGQREVEIRDKEIAFNKIALTNQQKLRWALIAGISLLFIIAGLLFYQSRTRKKTNTTLMVLNNELDEANKVKAKFFGILSHDLRSPVANLINFLQLQQRHPGILNEQQIASSEKKIADSAGLLLETMEGMLLWSKGQMENFKPEISEVPVNELFVYLQHFFSDNTTVSFSFINNDNLMLCTDANYLQTIMRNLTANAIKALQQTTGAQITWNAWRENNSSYLSITDNGPGINSEQAKALFDETSVTGTRHGLGLHIIRDLAKAIKCKINIEAGNMQGATFVLAL